MVPRPSSGELWGLHLMPPRILVDCCLPNGDFLFTFMFLLFFQCVTYLCASNMKINLNHLIIYLNLVCSVVFIQHLFPACVTDVLLHYLQCVPLFVLCIFAFALFSCGQSLYFFTRDDGEPGVSQRNSSHQHKAAALHRGQEVSSLPPAAGTPSSSSLCTPSSLPVMD